MRIYKLYKTDKFSINLYFHVSLKYTHKLNDLDIGLDIEKSGDGVENIGSASMTTSYLMCIYEQGAIKGDQKTTIGIMVCLQS